MSEGALVGRGAGPGMRRVGRYRGWPLLWLLALLLACRAQERAELQTGEEPLPPVEARVGVDRAVATTGDVITYTVEIEHDEGYEVELEEPGAEIAGFRVLDLGREEPRRSGGRTVDARWYELRADLVGSYILPPVTVRYWPSREDGSPPPDEEKESLTTSEIFVEVESVLASAEEASDIRDIKAIREVKDPFPWQRALFVGLALLLLAALAVYLRWRQGRRPAAPPPPPHEIAFAALDALRRTDFDDPEAVRRYYFGLSEVIRAYVEARFGLNATDLTTEEIVPRLHRLEELGGDQRSSLEIFLEETDRVKFAAYEPTKEEMAEVYERALVLVEETRPTMPPEGESESVEKAA